MKKQTIKNKMLTWAANKETKVIKSAIKQTGQTEKAFMYRLNRLRRMGLIKFTRNGKNVTLELAPGFYNEYEIVK